MAAATEFINCLKKRGVTFQGESASELRVLGISRLSEQKREILKRHKAAILRALTPPPTGVPTATTSSEPVAPATAATEPLPDRTEPAARSNRPAMPHIASVVDVRRQGFGADQVKVAFAEENGVRLGRQDAGPKAGTCYYCRRWQGTKSGKGWCCISFAPPVARRADESCELFTQEVKS